MCDLLDAAVRRVPRPSRVLMASSAATILADASGSRLEMAPLES